MTFQSLLQRLGRWLAVAAFVGAGLAMAQSEPSLNQVYEAVRAGRLEQAQTMVQQVLVANPNSAKAYFVQAELSARQGDAARARDALAKAEQLAPGLPFVKPEAAQALRAQLAGATNAAAGSARSGVGDGMTASFGEGNSSAAGFPWAMVLAGGAVLAAVLFFMRRRNPAQSFVPPPAPYGNPGAPGAYAGGMAGPQSFGAGTGAGHPMGAGSMQPGYGNASAAGYGQPVGTGLGGRVAGGLATGLAVGAGVLAAQALGRNLMGNDAQAAGAADASGNSYAPLPGNSDLGGQDIGINDASSWDDGSLTDVGGDWDT